jgi:hypothetical protein
VKTCCRWRPGCSATWPTGPGTTWCGRRTTTAVWRTDAAALATRLRDATAASYEDADHQQIAPNLALATGLYGCAPRPVDDGIVARLGRSNWLVPELVDHLWRSATFIDGGAAVFD